ncbi:MAG: thioredoxin domain-containing protein [Candidatus Micrarchaeota archaeon]
MSKTKNYKKQKKFGTKSSDNSILSKNFLIVLSIAVLLAFGIFLFLQAPSNKTPINTTIKSDTSNLSQPTSSSLPYLNPRAYITSSDPVIGNTSSKLTIIEFGDFQCPYCKTFYIEQLPLIKINYLDTNLASFIYLNSPFPSLHDKSVDASLAGFCAKEQNNFYQMHNLLFEKQDAWNRTHKELFNNMLLSYSKELNLNQSQFVSCLESKKYASELDAEINASMSLGVSGTPTFFILIQKDKIKGLDFQSKFDQIRSNSVSGFALTPYQNEKDYVIVISGFVDYKTLKAVLDIN